MPPDIAVPPGVIELEVEPRRRAATLPPERRRAEIVAATLGLLRERGESVTTKQIAEAAGIAEGTIFRVFPDKEAVLRAAVDEAFDPAESEAALAAIDRHLPFEAQLAAAVKVMQRRMADIWRLVSAVGEEAALRGRKRMGPPDLRSLTDLFEPYRDQLRSDPRTAARQLRALTVATTHPAVYGDKAMSPKEIVSLLLDGIRIGGHPC